MDLSSTEAALHSELILLLCDEIESRLPERHPRYVRPIYAAFVSWQLLRRTQACSFSAIPSTQSAGSRSPPFRLVYSYSWEQCEELMI